MLPERAFQPRNGRSGMTLEGGGGGPSSSTTYTSNIPNWMRPQVETLLGAGMQEYFNVGPDGQIQGVKPFVPYSTNMEDYVAQFSPLQQQVQYEAAGMQRPGQFGVGSEYAGQAGMGGLESAGQAYGYGGAGYGSGMLGQQLGTQGGGFYGGLGAGYGGAAAGMSPEAQRYGQMGAGTGQRYEQMATDPGSIQAYMSPYMQNVVDLQKEAAIEDYQRNTLPQLQAQAVRAGAFGGSRDAVQRAMAQRGLSSQLQNIQATGTQKAFEDAQRAQQFGITSGLQGLQTGLQGLGQAGQLYGLGMQGAQTGLQGVQQQLAGTAQGMQGAGLGLQGVQGAQAGYNLLGQSGVNLANIGAAQQAADIARMDLQGRMGAEQQAREQQMINQAIQNFGMAQEYPFEQLSKYSGLLRGYYTPSTTASTYSAAPNAASQLTGAALTAFGATRKKGGTIKEKKYAEGGITSIDQKVLRNPTAFSPEMINKGMQNDSINDAIGAIALSKIADAKKQAQMQQGLAGGPPQGTILAELQQAAMTPGIDQLPSNLPPQGMAGGGIVAFARGDLVEQGINEPLPGESYTDYLVRRAKESMRGPMFSEKGTMPGAGMSEAQSEMYNKAIQNQKRFGDILAGKGPVQAPVPAATSERYADETTRGTAGRVAKGGANRSMEELGVGAAEMSARRAAEEAANKTPAAPAAAAPAAKEEVMEDALARRKRMLKEAGVSEDPFAKDRAANAAMKEQLGKDREKAFNMALIEAGLGIMGGTSPHFAQNLAQAKGAIGSYAKSMKDIKADEKEFAKIDRDMRKAEDAMRRGDVDKALEYEDKAKQREIQLRGVQAQERAASKPSSVNEILAALQSNDPKVRAAAEKYLGAAKTGQVDERFLREQWSKMKPLDKMLLERQGIKSFEDWAASQGYPMGGGAARFQGFSAKPIGQ